MLQEFYIFTHMEHWPTVQYADCEIEDNYYWLFLINFWLLNVVIINNELHFEVPPIREKHNIHLPANE